MKTRVLILLYLNASLFFFACKKDDTVDKTFNVTGIQDIKTAIGETKTLTITISKSKNSTNNISLSLKDVPKGVKYTFNISEGNTNFETSLSLNATSQAALGKYSITLEAVTEDVVRKIPFYLNIDDQLSMSLTVYDATLWSTEFPSGKLSEGAIVNLFKDKAAFEAKKPTYSDTTDVNGKAKFYHLPSSAYLFTVEKHNLSNIAAKKSINNELRGFITVDIFKNHLQIQNSAQPDAKIGDMKFRDQNVDGIINDEDRCTFDMVSIYDKTTTQKVIWIGN